MFVYYSWPSVASYLVSLEDPMISNNSWALAVFSSSQIFGPKLGKVCSHMVRATMPLSPDCLEWVLSRVVVSIVGVATSPAQQLVIQGKKYPQNSNEQCPTLATKVVGRWKMLSSSSIVSPLTQTMGNQEIRKQRRSRRARSTVIFPSGV